MMFLDICISKISTLIAYLWNFLIYLSCKSRDRSETYCPLKNEVTIGGSAEYILLGAAVNDLLKN